ncbi:hypothetical protein AMECASPLE_035076, partial [Ameca splendens]
NSEYDKQEGRKEEEEHKQEDESQAKRSSENCFVTTFPPAGCRVRGSFYRNLDTSYGKWQLIERSGLPLPPSSALDS